MKVQLGSTPTTSVIEKFKFVKVIPDFHLNQ